MQAKKITGILVGSLNGLLACAASGAYAAPDVAAKGTSLEEVVVTARKREEAVQSVPLAISALTGDMVERNNIKDVSSLSAQVPSLMVVPGVGANKTTPTFAIRGLSQQELTILADPSVTVYFDDVVVARSQGMNQAMYDIQSVEVLKGPQGTLFGRNVTGGAINIKPNQPSEVFEGYVKGTVGNDGRRNAEGMVNVPVNDVVQVRAAVKTTHSDGYLKDVVLDDNINTEKTNSGRFAVALRPFDGLESITTYDRFLENDGGTGAYIVGGTSALGVPGYVTQQQSRSIYQTASGADQYARVATWDLNNTTQYELNDSISFKNVVGYRHVVSHAADDVDGTPIVLLQIERDDDMQQFSEEFQMLGSSENLDWIAGLYYFHEQGNNYDPSVNFYGPYPTVPQPTPLAFAGRWSITDVSADNESRAVFGQGTYDMGGLVEGLSLTGGGRYTWDRKSVSVYNQNTGGTKCSFTNAGTAIPVSQCRFDDSKDYGQLTYNLSVDYHITPDAMVYLAHRKGYRSGGFGARATTLSGLGVTFEPEILKDIELGTKVDWHFDNGMSARSNLALYWSDFSDIQRLHNILVTNTGGTQQAVTAPINGQKAEVHGAELELTFLPVQGLELSGFYAYTDTRYTKFTIPNTTGGVDDLSQGPFARAPQSVYSLTGRYTLPLDKSIGDISLQANYWWTDKYAVGDDYVATDRNFWMPSYHLINTRLDWKGVMGTPFDVSVFCDNVTGEDYSLPSIYVAGFVQSRTPGEPRTYGLELKYRFGALAE